MTRQEALSRSSRFSPDECYRPAVRDPGMLPGGGRNHARAAPFRPRYEHLEDGQVAQNVADILSRLLYPKKAERGEFSGKTQLILNATCAEYLGYYPTRALCKSEIKAILKEMARHGRSWENGISCMENCFHGTENAIREMRRYAKWHGIRLPPP